jgi:16S rRNA (cytidine1402-2'-O)-methyltransferase
MDTPYRNRQVYEELLKVCSNDTLMCIGMEITAESEYIRTLPIGDWKKIEMPDIHKKPCMFAISG